MRAPILVVAVLLVGSLCSCAPTYPGGLSKQEWDALPPERRAQLQMQQDQLDEQRRENQQRDEARNQALAQQQQQSAPPQYVPVQAPDPNDLTGWTFLGKREVNFRTDHDVFQLGKSYGLISAIKFAVRGGDIDLYNVTVVFGDGEKIAPDLRGHYQDNTASIGIGFPGTQRYIDRVEFTYRSSPHNDRKTSVLLFIK